ncbi:hypothetical protein [Streptomyces puniciscabiei]|uniref:hypothetical protein n=1 Tax=Streptomyces puniciscabiei TaxID=164348 RepID=UPI00331CEFBF
MTNIDDASVDELARIWGEIHNRYQRSRDEGHDRWVLDSAARLAADPGADTAWLWILGLTLMARYTAWLPGEGVEAAARDALEAADRRLRDHRCAHASHPYRIHDEDDDWRLADLVRSLADATGEWGEDRPREEWLCPCNLAGYARIALDILEPGSVQDVPPRIPADIQADIETLSSVLNLYPNGVDPDEDLASQGWSLSLADEAERPGRLLVARAVSWHVVSGMVRRKSVLDGLIEAVERTLPHYVGATCAHDGHPELEDSGPEAAETGLRLSCRAGREIYERDRERWDEPPLEGLLCPVHLAEIARETLTILREGRDRLFGDRPTDHLDAEYLRADGRLDIEKIVERLDHKPWNEEYADDLGLWAARRYAGAGARERVVLFVIAYQTMKISYPAPPPAVAVGVLDMMRPLASVPRPAHCAHPDDHPAPRYADFRHSLPQVYAPGDFARTEHSRSLESWTCPRFTATLAQGCVSGLEKLDTE